MSKYIVTIEEAKYALDLSKQTTDPMDWRVENASYGSSRYKYKTACQVLRTTIKGLFFHCAYKSDVFYPNSAEIRIHKNINVGLYFNNCRISAIDYCQSEHRNNIGEGLPYYGEIFNGLHRHIWLEEGYGYAEPIVPDWEINLENIIKLFCIENNLDILNGYKAPFTEEQLSLI